MTDWIELDRAIDLCERIASAHGRGYSGASRMMAIGAMDCAEALRKEKSMGFLKELKETAETLGNRVEEGLDRAGEVLRESSEKTAALPQAQLEVLQAILVEQQKQTEILTNLYRDLSRAIEHKVPEMSS